VAFRILVFLCNGAASCANGVLSQNLAQNQHKFLNLLRKMRSDRASTTDGITARHYLDIKVCADKGYPMDHVDRILSQWKQVRPDLDVAPMETVGRINRLSSLLRHEMEKTWKLHGLNAASFDMLAALRRSDSTQGLAPTRHFKYWFALSLTAPSIPEIHILEWLGDLDFFDQRDRVL
jgi:hypothetical protein